jgi:hypothetical protein
VKRPSCINRRRPGARKMSVKGAPRRPRADLAGFSAPWDPRCPCCDYPSSSRAPREDNMAGSYARASLRSTFTCSTAPLARSGAERPQISSPRSRESITSVQVSVFRKMPSPKRGRSPRGPPRGAEAGAISPAAPPSPAPSAPDRPSGPILILAVRPAIPSLPVEHAVERTSSR